MGGSKKGGEMEVTDYLMSLHYGIFLGPVDSIKKIVIADKDIGIGEITSNQTIAVDKKNLFGGPKKGGGVFGTIHYLFGAADQILSPFLASKMERTPTTMTGYRGFTSLFFTGNPGGPAGFTWGTNNPFIPEIEVTASRAPVALDNDSMIGPDANPAHMVAECLVSDVWGSSYRPDQIDMESFLYSASTFRDEELGLSMRWTGEQSVEDFLNNIIRHANASLTFDFVEDRWFMKPLRGDYVVADLNYYGPDEVSLINFQRRAWGETVNQVTVTWTNPENEKTETVVVQDLSGFEVQGRAIADSSGKYTGARNRELALKLAERDLRQAAAPLSSVEIEVSSGMLKNRVGDVVVFEWYESDSDFRVRPTVMRIVKITKGERGAASRRAYLMEDIYAFGVSPTVAVVDKAESNSQGAVDITNYRIGSAPYFVAANVIGDTAARDAEYPSVGVYIYANSGLTDLRDIDVLSELPRPEQSPSYQLVGTVDEADMFSTIDDMVVESTSTMLLPISYRPSKMEIGGFLIFTNGEAEEICVITDVTIATVSLKRGVLDTVPHAWSAGTTTWVTPRNFDGYEETERAVGETAKYKLLPITSLGRLIPSAASVRSVTLSDRPYLPLRPANVRVRGQLGPTATVGLLDDFTVSWSNRNRTTETSQVLSWTDGTVTPEIGQMTRLRVRKNGTWIADSSVGGTDMTFDTATWGLALGDVLEVRVESTRDGFSSWQGTAITVTIV